MNYRICVSSNGIAMSKNDAARAGDALPVSEEKCDGRWGRDMPILRSAARNLLDECFGGSSACLQQSAHGPARRRVVVPTDCMRLRRSSAHAAVDFTYIPVKTSRQRNSLSKMMDGAVRRGW